MFWEGGEPKRLSEVLQDKFILDSVPLLLVSSTVGRRDYPPAGCVLAASFAVLTVGDLVLAWSIHGIQVHKKYK